MRILNFPDHKGTPSCDWFNVEKEKEKEMQEIWNQNNQLVLRSVERSIDFYVSERETQITETSLFFGIFPQIFYLQTWQTSSDFNVFLSKT